MGPGQLFIKHYTNKRKNRWKRLVDDGGLVHHGKRMHRVVHSHKSEPTEIYQARCDRSLQLSQMTEADLNCLLCIGAG